MRFRYHEVLSGLGLFSLVCNPSIKLIYASEFINFIPLVILFFSVLGRWGKLISSIRKTLFLLWTTLAATVFASYFWGFYLNSFSDVARLVYFYLVITLVIFSVDNSSTQISAKCIVAWGLFIALWQILFRIKTNYELGQTYLTVALPLGLALSYCIFRVSGFGVTVYSRIIYFSITVVLLLALATLLSRAALIFPLISWFIVYLAYLFFGRNISSFSRIRNFSIILVLCIFSGITIFQHIELRQLDKISRLADSMESEPRMVVYKAAILYVLEKPIVGYGIGSAEHLFGKYPHNIFLEVLTTGGILLLFIFLSMIVLIMTLWLFLIRAKAGADAHSLAFVSCSLFLFMQWNTSFDFLTAYIPLSTMIAAALLNERRTCAMQSGGRYAL